MKDTWWKSGQYNALCDVCGFKFKNTDLRKRWDGLMVCGKDWETRHLQELIRPVPDQRKLPWTKPESSYIFIGPSTVTLGCTANTVSAVPGQGSPGCMVPGYLDPFYS